MLLCICYEIYAVHLTTNFFLVSYSWVLVQLHGPQIVMSFLCVVYFNLTSIFSLH
jgi:hypothetical protein